ILPLDTIFTRTNRPPASATSQLGSSSQKEVDMKRQITLLLAIALLLSLSLPAIATGNLPTERAAAHPSLSEQNTKMKQLDFRNAMRKLWEDHITWTRVLIISAAADLPDRDAATQRLLQNQVDIGNAIKPYYGAAAGDQL